MSFAPARLRPGLHVVRREAGQLQVGLDPPHRVIVADDPRCLDLLELLRHGAPLGALGTLDSVQTRLLRGLRHAGLLLEVSDEGEGPGGWAPRSVALLDRGLTPGLDALAALLEDGAVEVVPDGGRVVPDLVVACSSGPLPRATVDPWLADGTPHLLLGGTGEPGSLRLGPLVEPGMTACLRCIDAAEAAGDPRRRLVVEQLATRTPAPLDALALSLALAWAARDIKTFLAGGVATTWSATVDLHEPLPTVHRWPRHPECGCCWDELPY